MAKKKKNGLVFYKRSLKGNLSSKLSRSPYKEFTAQLVTLSTSAFGFAAALAWNETIQQTVKDFIEPTVPGSGVLSRFIYAILVTLLGVLVTFQLSRLAQRWGLKR